MASEDRLVDLIKSHWDVDGLIADLRAQKWQQTEPNRIDRMAWIGSYDAIRRLASDSVSDEEWAEAEAEGFEDEIVEKYMETLAKVVMDAMGKELRREHVYTIFEEGDAFLGQYEDISPDELRSMGFEIGGHAVLGAIELIELGQARPKKRVPIAQATKIAKQIERRLGPLSDTLILVGSIRRKRPEIGDIEFVVLPNGWDRGDEALEEFADALRDLGYTTGPSIRKATKIFRGIKIEIYIAHDPKELGGLVFMYTGDFQFNIAMRRKAKRMGYRLNQYGIFDQEGNPVLQSPDEREFFDFLGVDYHWPEERSVATRTPEEKRRRAQAKRRKATPRKKRRRRARRRMGSLDEAFFQRLNGIWDDDQEVEVDGSEEE